MSDLENKEAPQEEIYDSDDVIVIKKSYLITGVVGIAAFLVGAMVGYFAFSFAAGRGNSGVADNGGAIIPQQQVAQPTAQPAIVEGVTADDDPSIGDEDAPILIVEFSDFQCPYCSRFHAQTLQPLLDEYGDQIRFVYRDYPLTSIHPDAYKAAIASECADEQGLFWELHDAMFQNQPITGVGLDAISTMAASIDGLDVDALNECIASDKYADEVQKDMTDATSYGVTGTPTFFINGVRLVGAQPLTSFTAIIEQELAK
jgi:protein-disulfide isomerase